MALEQPLMALEQPLMALEQPLKALYDLDSIEIPVIGSAIGPQFCPYVRVWERLLGKSRRIL